MAIRIYNKLPNVFKDLNFMTFKKKLFDFLLFKCYYSTDKFLNENFTLNLNWTTNCPYIRND